MELLYGKPIADKILLQLKNQVHAHKTTPGLATILVGDNEASKIYIRMKKKAAQYVGIQFIEKFFPLTATEQSVIDCIQQYNERADVHGILVQLPLPERMHRDEVIRSLDRSKDVDGLRTSSQKSFLQKGDGFFSPFSLALVDALLASGGDFTEKKVVLIVNSPMFAAALQDLLQTQNISSHIILSRDREQFLDLVAQADAIITATGKARSVRGGDIKKGVVLIDGGIEKVGDTVCGDVDMESVSKKAAYLTPVPGGVGPLTIAHLMRNVVHSADILA